MECASCKKPATLACSGCNNCPTFEREATVVQYCSANCQKEDWETHKPTCLRLKDRQLLYHVASTAQQLFYIQKELTWYTFEIEKVDRNEDELDMWKFSYPGSQTIEGVLNLRGNDLEKQGRYDARYPAAIPFPANLLPEKKDQEAALSYRAGIQANSWMIEFVQGMLNKIVKNSVVVEHRTKGEKLLVKFHPNQKGSGLSSLFPFAVQQIKELHYVLKVTLRSGEVFAIDLAGAQHGHHEPVTPWEQFKKERILNVLSTKPAQAPKGLLRVHDFSPEMIERLHQEKHATDAHPKMIIDDIFETMNHEILIWQKENISLKDMWKLPDDKFLAKQRNLVDFMHWALNWESSDYKTVHGAELRKQIGENWVHGTD